MGCRFPLQSKCYRHPYFTDVETEAVRRQVTCPRSHSQKRLGQGLSSQGSPGGPQGSGLLGLWPVCPLPRRRVGAEGEPGAESGPDNVPALGHRHPLWGTWSPPCAQTTAHFLLIAAGGLWAQSGLHHAWGQLRAPVRLSAGCPSGQAILSAGAAWPWRSWSPPESLGLQQQWPLNSSWHPWGH